MITYTGRICTWCGQKELARNTVEELQEWMKMPRTCCAPDGDGHLWREMYDHEKEPQSVNTGIVRRVIVSKSFAERWTTNPQDYRDYYKTQDVEVNGYLA